jgi:hypothetical protein
LLGATNSFTRDEILRDQENLRPNATSNVALADSAPFCSQARFPSTPLDPSFPAFFRPADWLPPVHGGPLFHRDKGCCSATNLSMTSYVK